MLTPLPRSEWTSTLAAHLLNRAGFGGSPAEISRTFRMGPTKAVDNLVEYQAIAENSSPPMFAQNGPPGPIDRRAMRELGEKERQKKGRRIDEKIPAT